MKLLKEDLALTEVPVEERGHTEIWDLLDVKILSKWIEVVSREDTCSPL